MSCIQEMPLVFVENTSMNVEGRVMQYDQEIGFFSISKKIPYSVCFYCEDSAYTQLLLSSVCNLAKTEFKPIDKIYVDSDTSQGVWDTLGFIKNPLYDFTEEQRHLEGAGYEKYILFNNLCSACKTPNIQSCIA